jgi:leucyl aminopeptidase (aminopeptidase T)
MAVFDALAKKVLKESLNVQKGETVTVETWTNGLELAKRVVLEARKIGATPLLLLEDEDIFVETAKTAPKEHLGIMGKHEYGLLSETNAYVFIPGPPIAAYTKAITQEERAASTAYNQSWYEAAAKARLRGARLSFGYIGRDFAKLYGKSMKNMVEHQLKASLVDLNELKETGNRIATYLSDEYDASIGSDAERLRFTLKGSIIVEDGIVDSKDVDEGNNMAYLPPGRVRKGIDPNSVNGSIEVSFTEIYSGRVEAIKMSFKDGMLLSWSAKRNAKALEDLINRIPQDKRRINFIEIGMNPVLRYGNAQDRFVSGAVTIGFPRFAGVLNRATLIAKGRKVVEKGRLVP